MFYVPNQSTEISAKARIFPPPLEEAQMHLIKETKNKTWKLRWMQPVKSQISVLIIKSSPWEEHKDVGNSEETKQREP